MVKYFCDICDSEIPDFKAFNVIEFYAVEDSYVNRVPSDKYACCDDCFQYILHVISEIPKVDDVRNFLRGNDK